MQSTLKKIGSNAKNLTRNLTAGAVLASTVASTDLVENFTTTLTRPTSNMIQTIENTSEALGQALKNTSKGNLLHSIGNTATLVPRVIGTSAEGLVKTASHATQYASGASQIIGNSLITWGKATQQSFSTTENSPDIDHQEIHLKDPSLLWRDGTHGLLQQKEPPKTKIGRWLGNVKKSLFNIPLNIGRIGTDIVTYTSQRVRWVVESVEGMSKDIKSSRSGVFTKGQSFWKKFWNIFTKGLRWSAKSLGKWGWNIVNEGIVKSGVALLGIGSNFIGRTLWNTVIPLFSTKAGREQKDNLFDGSSRHERFQWYYTSTPRKIDSSATSSAITSEKAAQKNSWKTQEKKSFQSAWLPVKNEKKWEEIKELETKENKKEQPETSNEKKEVNSSTAKNSPIDKEETTPIEKEKSDEIIQEQQESNISKEKEEVPDEKIETIRKNITDTQRLFVKNYNDKVPISEQESMKWVKELQWYIDKNGSVIFSWTSDTIDSVISATVTKLILGENNNLTIQGLSDNQEAFTITIPLSELFAPDLGFHLPVKKK